MWAYYYIYENWKIYELPWDSLFTWIAAALLTDLGYYWVHRAAHGNYEKKINRMVSNKSVVRLHICLKQSVCCWKKPTSEKDKIQICTCTINHMLIMDGPL